ncbi:serine threonine kinase [Cryptosporidium ubiquitum]|uniref:Serine threonine kinase n=1 Tax=Cryptosporidium ubiquitum TaxID=857276 RepID=A0A1J4MCN0_9CRYT|nr:serine threonine kinase [Cryptosporidium ubiquitum]OII71243.1 serine threonine kinase [Cryptosporidium ubiquitum]
MDQRIKPKNGFNYINGSSKYTEMLRNGQSNDCLNTDNNIHDNNNNYIDNHMDLPQNRKRTYYESRRIGVRPRKIDINVYGCNRNVNHAGMNISKVNVMPEYEYETQYVASTEKQLDNTNIDSNGYYHKRYYGNNNNNINMHMNTNSGIITNYGTNSGYNILNTRNNMNNNSYGGGSNSYYYNYYDDVKKRREGSSRSGILRSRGTVVTEYRSYDSRGSSITYYNYSNKKVRHSEDSIDHSQGNELSKEYRNRNNINSNINTNSDEIEHFQWYVGQYLTSRYRILDMIGEGTFGRVFECEDLKRKRKVAIKVIRDVQRYTSAAKIEAEILRDINMEDEFGEYSYCVMLYNAFLYNNSNMCLVFERLGPSLYDFLDGNCSRGFFLADIQNIAEQFLLALSFLRKIKLTHTDLKLENILFTDNNYIWVNAPRHPGALIRRPVRPEIRLIDFGAATYEHDYHGSVINTRQYRAPEVILDLGWDMSSDMWGFGCILMELYTGVLLFKTHEHMEHLAMVERIIEPFPDYMLKKAYNSSKSGRKYVNRFKINNNIDKSEQYEYGKNINNGNNYNSIVKEDYGYILNWPEGSSSSSSIKRVNDCRPLESLVHKKHIMLAKFIRYILRPDPNLRPTPEMALRHEFFRYKFEEEI